MIPRALFLFAVCLLLAAPVVHAQIYAPGEPLTLTVSPQYPAPGETVRLSLNSYSIDLERSSITWRSNGTVIANGGGVKEASVVVGKLGSATRVSVSVIDENGDPWGTEAVLRPAEIDIIWNADSYAPPFFKGRARAGASSEIRAHALVRFVRADGSLVPESDIIYTWFQNGAEKPAVSGRGKSSARLPAPALRGTDSIAIRAETLDRAYSGATSVAVPKSDAFLTLYENHPLFGILYHRAIIGEVNTNEREQKVTAVPYFSQVFSPDDDSLSYSWAVNGVSITAEPDEPSTLTLSVDGYSGPADITLTLTSATDMLLRAAGSWNMVFGANTGAFFGTGIFGE